MKKAIVFGSTGMTGRCLLKLLNEDKSYELVICFVRKDQKPISEKVHYIITDFSNLSVTKTQFTSADIFCCLGTTIKTVNYDKEAFKRVDLYIPLEIAKLAKDELARQLIVISSMGANKKSVFFYNQVKGELEEKLKEMNLPSLSILQPSLLTGNRQEKRSGEKLANAIINFCNPILIGPLRKYRSISGDEVAKAMLYLANQNFNGCKTYQSGQLKELANTPAPSIT